MMTKRPFMTNAENNIAKEQKKETHAFFDDEYESPDDDEYESPAVAAEGPATAGPATVPITATATIPIPTESNPSNVPITHAELQSRIKSEAVAVAFSGVTLTRTEGC